MSHQKVKIINISLPSELLVKIDAAANAEFTSRSDFLRQAAIDRMHMMQQRTVHAQVSPQSSVEQNDVTEWRRSGWDRHQRPSATPDE